MAQDGGGQRQTSRIGAHVLHAEREALNPDHPAHDYFAEREERIVEVAANIRWHVPEGVDAEQVLRSGFAMMDGAQLRWLRVPGRDLNEMWASCEDVLFPLPQWEGYR